MENFKPNILINFKDLMAESIKDETPYKLAINYIDKATEDGIIDDKEKVEAISTMMAQIVVGTTSKAMDTALSMEIQDQKLDKNLLLLDKQIAGSTANTAAIEADTARKDSINTKQLSKMQEEIDLLSGTKQHKIELADAQVDKVIAETNMINEEKTQLIASVGFNNKIKAADSLADTYGTFGAGGANVSADMWAVYYRIISDLTAVSAPTSTIVAKI